MLQTCRRHPSAVFALSCPGCKQETHDRQYPEYAITRPRSQESAVTATQILAVGIAILCDPSPRAGWDHDIQADLDRRDAAHRAMGTAEFGSDEWQTARRQRRAAEIRIGSAFGLAYRPGLR